MAKNTAVQLLDDLTGEPAAETIGFALDGIDYASMAIVTTGWCASDAAAPTKGIAIAVSKTGTKALRIYIHPLSAARISAGRH